MKLNNQLVIHANQEAVNYDTFFLVIFISLQWMAIKEKTTNMVQIKSL